MIEIQDTFLGGMDLFSSEHNIPKDAYRLLINGRNRFDEVRPIKKSIKLNKPAGTKLNGGVDVGNVLLAFVDGKAYYQTDGSDSWIKLPEFSMNPNADYYFEKVPASSFNYVRKSTGNVHAAIFATVDFRVAGTPQALVVQDGNNQPWLIMYDEVNQTLITRLAKTYDQWQNVSSTADDREYVPIGRQMMYKDGVLYIVSRDNKYVMRSVTGRPLDFVINVDTNGNKMPSELQGGASISSFAFDYDDITCIAPIDVEGAFIYATAKKTRIVVVDWTRTVWGEPLYKVGAEIDSGIVNHKSFIPLLGDYAFVDKEGIRSFNAVHQLKWEGKNSNFSLSLASIMKGIKQTKSCCTMFDNYAMFNLDTTFGNVICIFDTLTNKWIGIDLTNVFRIKQFVQVTTASAVKLYAFTQLNEIWLMYGSTEVEAATFKSREFHPEEVSILHKGQYFTALFNKSTVAGRVQLIEEVDGQESQEVREYKNVESSVSGVNYPVIPPVKPNNKDKVVPLYWNTSNGLQGRGISYTLTWNIDASLQEFEIATTESKRSNSPSQQNQVYANS